MARIANSNGSNGSKRSAIKRAYATRASSRKEKTPQWDNSNIPF